MEIGKDEITIIGGATAWLLTVGGLVSKSSKVVSRVESLEKDMTEVKQVQKSHEDQLNDIARALALLDQKLDIKLTQINEGFQKYEDINQKTLLEFSENYRQQNKDIRELITQVAALG